jgi:hypothetical protein
MVNADERTALRAGILALLGRMQSEERRFEASLSDGERVDDGSAQHWGAKVVLAHITDFKGEQVARLDAAADGSEPPSFPRIDHRDPAAYAAYLARSWDQVRADAVRTCEALVEHTRTLDTQILFTPGIYPWLQGRALWAQILVRGVWHPSGHLHQYLAEHGQTDRVLELQQGLLGAATTANIPDVPGGRPFAIYNLACAHALAGQPEPALDRLVEAVELDPALARAALKDADLEALRDAPRFAELVAPAGS